LLLLLVAYGQIVLYVDRDFRGRIGDGASAVGGNTVSDDNGGF
jgi:hypothetical protein